MSQKRLAQSCGGVDTVADVNYDEIRRLVAEAAEAQKSVDHLMRQAGRSPIADVMKEVAERQEQYEELLRGVASPALDEGLRRAHEQARRYEELLNSVLDVDPDGVIASAHALQSDADSLVDTVASEALDSSRDARLVWVPIALGYATWSLAILLAAAQNAPEFVPYLQLMLGLVGAEIVRQLRRSFS